MTAWLLPARNWTGMHSMHVPLTRKLQKRSATAEARKMTTAILAVCAVNSVP